MSSSRYNSKLIIILMIKTFHCSIFCIGNIHLTVLQSSQFLYQPTVLNPHKQLFYSILCLYRFLLTILECNANKKFCHADISVKLSIYATDDTNTGASSSCFTKATLSFPTSTFVIDSCFSYHNRKSFLYYLPNTFLQEFYHLSYIPLLQNRLHLPRIVLVFFCNYPFVLYSLVTAI